MFLGRRLRYRQAKYLHKPFIKIRRANLYYLSRIKPFDILGVCIFRNFKEICEKKLYRTMETFRNNG
jgi:hypothetical protein